MLKNILHTAWRSIANQKGYSILNIAGLAAGLASFIFIALWVQDEMSFDKFNKRYDRIFRLVSADKEGNAYAMSGAPMAAALIHDYPEVENAVRLRQREEIVTYEHRQILQSGILITDPSFFQVFSYLLMRWRKGLRRLASEKCWELPSEI
ncbi:MAG TPA: ABC transporter permease [Puia sp.]|nr:ABC transporter permease [Puia sp.]